MIIFGMNKFTSDAPVMVVISEEKYVKTAAFGSKVTGNDYRSVDIGIAAAYFTSAAEEQGLSTCILGWFDEDKIKELCGIKNAVRLVISVGYAARGDRLRPKKRKPLEKIVDFL